MKATHNSFTYAKPRIKALGLFSKIWRCQDKNLEQQITDGAEAIDFRVRWRNGGWQLCHGIVDLDIKAFTSLAEIGNYVNELSKRSGKNICYRVIFERGGWKAYARFADEARIIQLDNSCFYIAARFLPDWYAMHNRHEKIGIRKATDKGCFKQWDFKHIIKAIFTEYEPIREHARGQRGYNDDFQQGEGRMAWYDFL